MVPLKSFRYLGHHGMCWLVWHAMVTAITLLPHGGSVNTKRKRISWHDTVIRRPYLNLNHFNFYPPFTEISHRLYYHRHTLLDAHSVFTLIENYGCQTSVVLYLFLKKLHRNFIWVTFIFGIAQIKITNNYYKFALKC